MKKYKLIKEYPGSPKLGYEIEGDEFESDSTFSVIECHKYPEYWEEIVEYPIGTRVHNSLTNVIYTKKKDGWYRPAEKTAYTDKMISSKKYITILDESKKVVQKDYEILSLSHFTKTHRILTAKSEIIAWKNGNGQSIWNIHSVKRLSDGEIFTIGDKVIHTNNVKNKLGIILDFRILSNGIWFKTDNYDVPMCYIHSKESKPLFTTEDGVDMYDSDTYYTVNFARNYPCNKIDIGIIRKGFVKNMSYKYFSTKEAAKKYIEWNQPKYSLKDIEKAFEHYQYRYKETIIRNLKNNMK
jgi:hypothetical protein